MSNEISRALESAMAALSNPAVLVALALVTAVMLAVDALKIVAFCRIFHKAGWHWAMGLLMLVPVIDLVMLVYLGFARWPIQDRVEPAGPPATSHPRPTR